ncbi:MAG: hypothetical protein ACFCBW_07875 [Candidatus Competibacterales bacterium]
MESTTTLSSYAEHDLVARFEARYGTARDHYQKLRYEGPLPAALMAPKTRLAPWRPPWPTLSLTPAPWCRPAMLAGGLAVLVLVAVLPLAPLMAPWSTSAPPVTVSTAPPPAVPPATVPNPRLARRDGVLGTTSLDLLRRKPLTLRPSLRNRPRLGLRLSRLDGLVPRSSRRPRSEGVSPASQLPTKADQSG